MRYRLLCSPRGFSETAILFTVIIIGLSLAGGLFINFRKYPQSQLSVTAGSLCCDTGDGANCRPQNDSAHPVLTYNGVQYGLLKSNITISDCARHLRDSNQLFSGNKIIIDTSNEVEGECGEGKNDMLADFRSGTKTCVAIPDDELVYVCRQNCNVPPDPSCDQEVNKRNFFGNGTTVYDVYFRLSDFPVPGVPDVIKNCQVPHIGWNPDDNKQNGSGNVVITPQTVISPSPYAEHKSLQLHTFLFNQNLSTSPHQWYRPFCKPEIYLYPEHKEQITVKIAPKGNLILTIPQYPPDGWHVTAFPNGKIDYQNTQYDYLFYEAQIPDDLSRPQNTGYVVAFDKLSDLFNTLLPKLGLYTKEQQEFSSYWLKVLPNSPYYFVSVVPQETLNNIAPLSIDPLPDTLIRVALNFQPLDKKISVAQPVLPNVSRGGFTVVEWGGLFKQDKNHPFSCLM